MRLRLEQVILPPNVTAGISLWQLVAMAHDMRCGHADPEPVQLLPGTCRECGTRRIHDGRHRYLAAYLAGRPDVLCSEM